MTKRIKLGYQTGVRGVLGSLALLVFAAVGLGACVGAPETREPDQDQAQDPQDLQSVEEPVGEASSAVAEGGTCNAFLGLTCDPGLNCCGSSPLYGTCRNLNTDGLNCGACGHECPRNYKIPGAPRICIGGQCY